MREICVVALERPGEKSRKDRGPSRRKEAFRKQIILGIMNSKTSLSQNNFDG